MMNLTKLEIIYCWATIVALRLFTSWLSFSASLPMSAQILVLFLLPVFWVIPVVFLLPLSVWLLVLFLLWFQTDFQFQLDFRFQSDFQFWNNLKIGQRDLMQKKLFASILSILSLVWGNWCKSNYLALLLLFFYFHTDTTNAKVMSCLFYPLIGQR